MSERCDRTTLVSVYGAGAEEYDTLWSPVILPPAKSMVAALDLGDATRVLDVGGGTGALTMSLSAAAPHALVTVIDPSWEMLRYAVEGRGAIGTRGDATALPFASACADAVMLAYVLFHLTDPSAGVREAARVLRPGGQLGTVTWAREWSSHAAEIWDRVFQELDVPDLPAHGNHTGLDTTAAVESLVADAGIQVVRTWYERIDYTFEPQRFWELRTRHGRSHARLALLDASARAQVLDELQRRLARTRRRDYRVRGQLVCAVGKRPS